MGKQERFQEAYKYLYDTGKIHSKQQLADALGCSRTSVSLAYNGNVTYLNDKFLRKFAREYPQISLGYLLAGDGELLSQPPKPEVHNKPTESIIELYATLIKEVEGMRQQLARELSEVHTIRAELRQSIADLQAATLEVQRTRDLLLSTPHNEALPSPTCNKPSGDTHHLSIAAEESETT